MDKIEKTMNGRLLFPHRKNKSNFVMSKYETEADAVKAYKDLERFLQCLSQNSLYEIMRELATYRAEVAKQTQKEYDELAEGVNEN